MAPTLAADWRVWCICPCFRSAARTYGRRRRWQTSISRRRHSATWSKSSPKLRSHRSSLIIWLQSGSSGSLPNSNQAARCSFRWGSGEGWLIRWEMWNKKQTPRQKEGRKEYKTAKKENRQGAQGVKETSQSWKFPNKMDDSSLRCCSAYWKINTGKKQQQKKQNTFYLHGTLLAFSFI